MTIRSNLHLPYGGEREGAEVICRNHCQSNLSWYIWTAFRHQPPPSLPRRGGTDTLGIDTPSIYGVTYISPTGENERGLKWLAEIIVKVTCHDIYEPLSNISPHLASPVGEGQIPLQVILSSVVVVWLSMAYQWLINGNSICPSPSGEARWGLIWLAEISCRVTCSFPWGRLGWVDLGEG